MSASQSENAAKAVANQEGEVGSHIAPTAPLQTTGHQPGQTVSDKDAAPTFHAETLPAGSAPASKTFEPQNITEIPRQAVDNYAAKQSEAGTTTAASDTIDGATSGDVHAGYGHPGQGMSSAEQHHDGKSHRARQAGGLQGVGAEGAPHHTDMKEKKLDTESPIPGVSQKMAGGKD